jgi:ATP-dependent DNA helicase RecG
LWTCPDWPYKSTVPGTTIHWETPFAELRGIGPERAAQLARLNLRTAGDLLQHLPHRYEDRRHSKRIADLQAGEAVTVTGQVTALGVKRYRKGTRSVFELILEDGSARLHCRWWNMPFLQNHFRVGQTLFLYGKITGLKPRTTDHPEVEIIEAGEESSLHLNRITPIYPLTEGLSQRWLRALVWRVLEAVLPALPAPEWEPLLSDLPTHQTALRQIHFPESDNQAETARRRLALDEFVELQLHLLERRRKFLAQARGLPCSGNNRHIKPFLAALGFALTGAQTRVLREIRHDLGGAHPMRRLVQGDVGCGKTVVAACAALMTLESGHHVALMAPTEILAEQHYQNFQRWFAPLGIPVELQTGNRKTGSPSTSHPNDPTTAPSLVIGTHALIEFTFQVPNLGLAIIDEQHKFGVCQRERLVRKGRYPHLLVLTATPIPRTLGLTLYGDLDLSIIDELPPGRVPVKTYVRPANARPKVLAFVRQKLAEGHQAYVVCPRVEADDNSQRKAVTREFEQLTKNLAPFTVGLLHGRLHPEEKERVMENFRHGTLQVLLATTVVEVGLDVANATIMVIENADHFGLAQLHQLRGRIGRGRRQGWCILLSDQSNPQSHQRLSVLAATQDGFRIAEEDLKLRGPGEFLGQQQSGLPSFHFGDLTRDTPLILRARDLAHSLTFER